MSVVFPEIKDGMSDEDLRQIAISYAKILREVEDSGFQLVRLINEWVVDRPEVMSRFKALIETGYMPGKNFWSEGAV